MITDKEYYGKGKRGLTYKARLSGRDVMIKQPNPSATTETISNEAAVLRMVNRHGIGPELISLGERDIVMEFIEGKTICEWLREAEPHDCKEVLVRILWQCRTLDEIGVTKEELTRPYKHIIVRGIEPVQIDFERTRRTSKPQNVTQCCHWLTTGFMREILANKGISLDRKRISDLAKGYKKDYSQDSFSLILKEVTHEFC